MWWPFKRNKFKHLKREDLVNSICELERQERTVEAEVYQKIKEIDALMEKGKKERNKELQLFYAKKIGHLQEEGCLWSRHCACTVICLIVKIVHRFGQSRNVYVKPAAHRSQWLTAGKVIIEPIISPCGTARCHLDEMTRHGRTPHTRCVLHLNVDSVQRTVQSAQVGIDVPTVCGKTARPLITLVRVEPVAVVIGGLPPCCPLQTEQESEK